MFKFLLVASSLFNIRYKKLRNSYIEMLKTQIKITKYSVTSSIPSNQSNEHFTKDFDISNSLDL